MERSLLNKQKYLSSLSEEEFRDKVVRELFFRLGFKDGREYCGPLEEGKDCIFIENNKFGDFDVIAVQTKKGNLNKSGKQHENLLYAKTQIRTALDSKIPFVEKKTSRLPDKVLLVISGRINLMARKDIIDELSDPRISIFDSDFLIPKIDEVFPELWLNINTNIFPYLKKIVVTNTGDELENSLNPITDENFIPLHFYRTDLQIKKIKGKIINDPVLNEYNLKDILVEKSKLILILGEGGSGKSTLLRRILFKCADDGLKDLENSIVPIFLIASELKNDEELIDLLTRETMKYSNSDKNVFTLDDLKNGRILALIDGLDEIGDEMDREVILEKILNFYSTYQNCKIILTSREYKFVQENIKLSPFKTFRISPISINEASELLKIYEKNKQITSKQSNEILRRLDNVHGFNLNPLLVKIFADTKEFTTSDIPPNITELFKKYTELMLGRWDENKGLAIQYQAELKFYILKNFGFYLHINRKRDINIEEFKKYVQDYLNSIGEDEINIDIITNEILYRSNLFNINGDLVSFRYFLVQEFFAGLGMENIDIIKKYVGDEWWQRPIVFYFGDKPGLTTALEQLFDLSKNDSTIDKFVFSVTFGLALQAAYRIPIQDKIRMYENMIDEITLSKNDVVKVIDGGDKYPIRNFILYYLIGKEAVACDILLRKDSRILSNATNSLVDIDSGMKEFYELKLFWLIINLLENDHIEKAFELLKKHKINDPILLLAISLNCFFIMKIKISSKESKRDAEKLLKYIDPRISGIKKIYLKEFKSILLEMRDGKIKEIEN
ncbi:MAG: NACHT domain-containing protein [Bacteroidetes bacterium]|nr:NACHT domain-containing protein [Bacteroidota bacterium]